ncbi:MAG TPA: hypothetical protein VER32_00540 [Pyrinomonadaceae bacterium]|nr:hypothetical protein [Pyrinomonadaceae bacterium]
MRRDVNLLTSPLFLAGLALLLANDLLLKSLFHNALTGKLSDFAGLFVFPFFWSALAPRRRRAAYVLTAAGFVFWKSPLSQPLLDAWNALGLMRVARVVDATDLVALAVLPLSEAYLLGRRRAAEDRPPTALAWRRYANAAVLLLSVFAFAATSYRTGFEYEGEAFTFADTREGLVKRFEKLQHKVWRGNHWSSRPGPDEYTIRIKADYCFDSISALVEMKEQPGGRTLLVLRRLEHECPEEGNDKADMLTIFMREVVEKLQDDIDADPRPAASPPVTLRRA